MACVETSSACTVLSGNLCTAIDNRPSDTAGALTDNRPSDTAGALTDNSPSDTAGALIDNRPSLLVL